MRELGKLSAASIVGLKKPGRYGDGRGLYLQISRWETKSWLLRYQLAGRSREMGLGSFDVVSLKEAREKARTARNLIVDGVDPIDTRKARKRALREEQAKRLLFKEAARQYIETHRVGWRNEKHIAQWYATLATYAYPIIGSLDVATIDTGHIIRILEPIWANVTSTASRVRGRIEAILDWAKVRGYRSGDNPARWKGHLDHLLPKRAKVRQVRHQPAMPFKDVPAFVRDLRSNGCVSALALEFTILCASRTGATIGATWDEIDLISGIWTIPGSRAGTKLRQAAHQVPLSNRAIALLRGPPREANNEHIFIGSRSGKGLSNMAMLELLQGSHPELTVHGFRSSFKDWASETTNFPDIVSEMALAHIVKDEVIVAYRRGTLLEKRKKLMEAWSRYCASETTLGNVTPLKRIA